MHSIRPLALRLLPVTALLFGMTSIQGGASIAKRLFPALGSPGTTVLRLIFAALLLNIAWRPWRHRLSRQTLRAVFIYGAALGLMNFCFYMAIERIPLGIGVALEFTGPLAVALFASRRSVDFIWAALATAGIVLITPLLGGTHALDPLGCLYALAAGLGWGLYILFGHRAGATAHAGIVTTLGMSVAALLVIPVAAFTADARVFDLSLWPLALVVAILSSALPYSLEMVALKRLRTQSFGILMSIEPAIGAIIGWLALDEHLMPQQWAAIACVIGASLGSTLTQRRDATQPVPV